MQQHYDAAAMSQPPAPPSHQGRTGGRRGKARMVSVGLLALTGLGWVSWIILLAGTAASQAKLEDVSAAAGRAFAMSWVVVVAFLLLLVVLSAVGVASLRRPAALHRGARALLFLLAILIAWGGIEANTSLAVMQTLEEEAENLDSAAVQDFLHRTRTWATGLVMTLLVCSFIALLLLLLDMLAPAARATTDTQQGSAADAAAGGVHKSGNYHGHALQYAQQQPQVMHMTPQSSGATPQFMQQGPQHAQQGQQYGAQPQQAPQYAAQPQHGQPQYVGPAVQVQAPPPQQQQSYQQHAPQQ